MRMEFWVAIACDQEKEEIIIVSFGMSKKAVTESAKKNGYAEGKSLIALQINGPPRRFVQQFRMFLADHDIVGAEATDIITGIANDIREMGKSKK